jgi:predicted SAM-dependent methyltransferase
MNPMIARKAIWTAVHVSTWARRRRRVQPDITPVKVNLGSGVSAAPGWINVDASIHAMCSKWPAGLLGLLHKHSEYGRTHSKEDYLKMLREGRYVHQSLEYGVPFDAESVDFIYSSHMLEHLFREDALALLRDAHRALKRNGRIRVAVPDLAYALRLYQEGAKQQAMSFFFCPDRDGWLNQHHYMYDFDLLTDLLQAVGFSQVERCSFRLGACPDLNFLDNRPEETLYVEATK